MFETDKKFQWNNNSKLSKHNIRNYITWNNVTGLVGYIQVLY